MTLIPRTSGLGPLQQPRTFNMMYSHRKYIRILRGISKHIPFYTEIVNCISQLYIKRVGLYLFEAIREDIVFHRRYTYVNVKQPANNDLLSVTVVYDRNKT